MLFRLILNLSPNLSQKTGRNPVTRALGHYGAGSALQELHTARPNQSTMGVASTNPRGGSMGLQGPPYAVLSPLVADPLAPPGDPNQVYSSPAVLYSRLVEYKMRSAHGLYILYGIKSDVLWKRAFFLAGVLWVHQ